MSPKRVLIVAAHPDDETLGAGGTIAKFSRQGHEITVLICAGHLPPLYPREAYERTVLEAQQAFAILGVSKSFFLGIPATMIRDEHVHVVNRRVSEVFEAIRPQVVLCPFPDRHIDHRDVLESVMVAARPIGVGRDIELLAAYETLSETHWNAPAIEPNFSPNLVVDISDDIKTKCDALSCYASQIPPFPGARSIRAVEALAMFRGTQAGFAYGEAFQIIRMTC